LKKQSLLKNQLFLQLDFEYFGFLFEEEVENLSQAFNPEHPFIFILGGAKFETKIPLVEKFLNNEL
jgi:3-phosphoglycerate kinase